MNTKLPVILLTFANEQQGGRYLDNVVKESKELTSILSAVSSNLNPKGSKDALCELVIKNNVNLGEIIEVLNDYKDRDLIFHFGGHADGYQLLLEGKDGSAELAKGDGLVPILGRRKNLKLVFLNGCSTQRLARDLVDHGIMAVIGTSASISDEVALMLSSRFYKGLAGGLTMSGAWEEAKDEVRAVKELSKSTRGTKLEQAAADRFPWDIEFRDDAAKEVFNKWNLPEEARNPLFNLPVPKPAQLPAEPFLFLKPYEAQHAEIFFGRSRYIRELWLKILEPVSPPIILLYGESGAGKSSLLDAGLRPRLEAATTNDGTEKAMFEVRYQRRDQDEGLIGTLARMLEYRPEQVIAAEATAAEPEEATLAAREIKARELEKLQQLEALAGELTEEKAKHTLLGIIERYRTLQNEVSRKTSPTGFYQNGLLSTEAGFELRKAWLALEQKTGRRLVIILDQVEELFTRPNAGQKQELEDLLQVLKDIFRSSPASGGQEIRGKIILGYREEFNAKIEARVKVWELSRSTVFLEQLNDADIHDIFRGLQTGRAKQEYNIQVEDKLPNLVANHLLNGKSAVAPVLQLLLTKLWRNAYQENSHAPAFTAAEFQAVQSGGEEMEEYFTTQMKKIGLWNPEVVESGLALDILHFHVSDLGTSNRRHIETIEQRYKHLEEEFYYPPDFILKLVNKLKSPDVFLLNDLGRGFTSLPHDTLAPIIIREYNRSDKYGQRSARILDTKAPDLIRALSAGEVALKKLRLDDNDLEVIQEGQKGMRTLEERERQLLQISLEEREKRLRLRRILVKGGIVAMLFILALSIFAGSLSVSMTEKIKSAVVSQAHEASLIEQDKVQKNPDQAIQLAQFAYRENDPKRLDVVNNLYSLYQNFNWLDPYDLYLENSEMDTAMLSISLKTPARINSLEYYPSLGSLVSLEDVTVQYWPNGSTTGKIIDLSQGFDNIKALEVGFSADGKKIQVKSRADQQPLFLLNKKLVPSLRMEIYAPPLYNSYYAGEEYASEDSLIVESENFSESNFMGYYDLFTGKFIDAFGLILSKEEFLDAYAYDLDPYGEGYDPLINTQNGLQVPVDTIFSFRLWVEGKNLLHKKDYFRLQEEPWIDQNLYFPPIEQDSGSIQLRPTHLSSAIYNGIFTWDPNNLTPEPENILWDTSSLFFVHALEDNKFLTVSSEREVQIREVQAWNTPGLPIASLLEADAGLTDIALSPNRQHILAMTDQDSILIWNLQGQPLNRFKHSNIEQYSFSIDGSQLMTLSTDSICVWSADKNVSRSFRKPLGAPPIAFARFHQGIDQNEAYLVIGLAYASVSNTDQGEGFWENIGLGKNQNKEKNARIVFWNIGQPEEAPVFEVPGPVLMDATVSEDQQFAVALQPGLATIIPFPNSKGIKSTTIEAEVTGRRENLKLSKVQLSPGGKYIVRQSTAERKVELFACNGEALNAYSFENGFRQGFNGPLFTPDDHFLIGSKSNEVLFWHPENAKTGKVIEWAEKFDLGINEKQENNIDTFMDYVPGTKLKAKWWAIAVVLCSFIFILLYFSDFIIHFVQQKNFLTLALYSGGFALFSLILLTLWIRGTTEPELKRAAFYLITLATLLIAFLGGLRAWKQKKFNMLFALAAVVLFSVFGAANFLAEEAVQHQVAYLKEIQKDYKQRKSYYDSLYQVGGATVAIAEQQKLSPTQLLKVAQTNKIELSYPLQSKQSEWPNLWVGLLIIVLFGVLVAYPIQRAMSKYEQEKVMEWGFYRRLFLPLVCLGFVSWLAYGVILLDDFGERTGALLESISILILLLLILRQSIFYIRSSQYTALIVYGLPVFLIGSLLLSVSGVFALTLACTTILGLRYYQQAAFGKAFLLFSTSIFLTLGALFWALLAENESSLYALLEAVILGLIFWGLRYQMHQIALRKAAKKSRWANRLAILGLWIISLVATLFLMENMTTVYDDYYPEEEYYFEEESSFEELDELEMAPDPDLEEEFLPEAIEATETESPVEDLLQSEPEQTALGLTQLVNNLFAPDKDLRVEAWAELKTKHSSDPALIEALIQATLEHPDMPEGIINALYLIEIQSDEVLQEQRDQLIPYLEMINNAEIADRVQAIEERIGN